MCLHLLYQFNSSNRVNSISLHLLNNGKEVEEVNLEQDGDTYTYNALPLYVNKELAKYTVTEDQVQGYKVGIITETKNGFEITNQLETTEITIKKIWNDNDNQDGIRPDSITLTLNDGSEVVLTKDENWTLTIKDLPKYKDGKEFKYEIVDEVVPDGYEPSYNGLEVTNTHTPEMIEIFVDKYWEDEDNKEGLRPEFITINLLDEDGTVLKTKEIGGIPMTFGFCDDDGNCEEEVIEVWGSYLGEYPKYRDGKEIQYSIEEILDEEHKNLYSVEWIKTINGFEITNTRIPEVTKVEIIKDWIDDENESGKRPESITISLLANGKEYETVTITEKDNWKHVFNNLPVYLDGEKVEYSVIEENVPEDYVVAYEETEEGFVIHNALGQGDIDPPTPPHVNPQTGDNIIMYVFTLLMSLIGIVSGKAYLKKYEN